LIGCAALYNSCAGSRMGLFVCFYFLISFFEFFHFLFLLGTELFHGEIEIGLFV